jgi:hypothetical protein
MKSERRPSRKLRSLAETLVAFGKAAHEKEETGGPNDPAK